MAERRTHEGVTYERAGPGMPWVEVLDGAGTVVTDPVDPRQPYQVQRDQLGVQRDRFETQNAPVETEFSRENALRTQFNALPEVRRYSEIVPVYIAARDAEDTRAGDLNLIYAFGKIMDPGSVVREAELNMVQGTSPIAERLRAIIGSELEGTGRLSPQTRRNLIDELRRRRLQLAQAYATARNNYIENARAFNIEPERVVGAHPAQVYADQERAAQEATTQRAQSSDQEPTGMPAGVSIVPATADAPEHYAVDPNASDPAGTAQPGSYQDSYLSQGLSGINEGIASTLGAPVDLVTSALNLVPAGVDAIANTDLGRIENPTLGGEWWRGLLTDAGAIGAEGTQPGSEFLRRVGQSVGAAAIPIAGTAGTLGRAGAGFLTAASGGAGAATAREVAPGNPWAEIGGEVVGSALGGAGLFGLASRNARRAAEAAVPTSQQLRQQASARYDSAEAGGLTASQDQTQGIAQRFRDIATQEGLISPTGRISEAYPKAREAIRMMDDYAAGEMTPTQMQSVRKVLSDAANSADGAEQRMATIMLREFDEFTAPLAPDLAVARGLYRRAAEADRIGVARALAEADSSQFSQSGVENALRTRFRQMERRDITGHENFSPAVSEAIERVSQGTSGGNFARNVGRMAPTGPFPITSGTTVGLLGAMIDPMVGGAMTTGLWGAGTAGRALATQATNRNAEIAELLARAGGEIRVAPVMDPELARMLAALGVSQSNAAGSQ